VLAQADLYRRAGSARRAGIQLADGVKRALAQAAAQHGGFGSASVTEVLAQLLEHTAVNQRDVHLVLEFLEARRAPGHQELLPLARACDAVRRGLRSQTG